MADKVDGDNIDKTIADLQEANKHNEKLVSKINKKMCTRPPFRFLHDNIITMMEHHKYHPDLYEGPELNAKEMDRQGKLDFLGKIIGVVTGDFPQVGELGIKPGKVCAGKECEKTRAFIQYLCLAATGSAGGADAAAPAAKEEAKQEEATEEAKEEPKEEPKQDEAKTEESAPAQTPASGSGSTSFGFTIADVDQSDENLAKTIEMLSFLEKPKPSEKHLNRPPFRFLHDLIIAILNSQSYHADLFEGPELKAKEMDKPQKVAFLAKIKDAVSADLGIDFELNPPKVCAGRECEKTRTFLQYLALAAHGVKGGGKAAPAAAAKPEPKKAEPKPAAEPKNETKTSEPDASSGPSESKTSGGGGDMNVDSGSVEKTAEMISAIISKPAMKPRLLQRPPFRFLHDVTFNIMKKTGFGIDKFNDEEKDAKAMPKPSRATVLQKMIDMTAETLGIEINVAPSKVTAGKECEQTRQFLQYFCIAATGGKLSTDSASPAPAPTSKKSRRAEEPKPKEPEPVPVESKTDSVQLPDKPRAESRPTTAKRAPPKLANAAQKKDLKKQFVLEDVGTDGVIMDGEEESDSSDDQNDVEEEHARHRSKKDKKDKNRQRGKLISKIESELETNAKKKKKTGKESKEKEEKKEGDSGIKLRRSIKRAPKDKINVESLRTQIQRLVQSTNPLSKCMDFVNDDLEAMDAEIDKWKSAYRIFSTQLEEEERKTAEQLAPVRREIEDVDKQVVSVLAKIREAKAKISQNDAKVTEMLRFVVNQK